MPRLDTFVLKHELDADEAAVMVDRKVKGWLNPCADTPVKW